MNSSNWLHTLIMSTNVFYRIDMMDRLHCSGSVDAEYWHFNMLYDSYSTVWKRLSVYVSECAAGVETVTHGVFSVCAPHMFTGTSRVSPVWTELQQASLVSEGNMLLIPAVNAAGLANLHLRLLVFLWAWQQGNVLLCLLAYCRCFLQMWWYWYFCRSALCLCCQLMSNIQHIESESWNK